MIRKREMLHCSVCQYHIKTALYNRLLYIVHFCYLGCLYLFKCKLLVTDLKTLLETELSDLCNQMLSLIDNYLVKKASSEESKVFYLKMKGDYYRYLAEITTGDKNKEVANNSRNSYKEASDLAENLACTNPIKLGLALNYSVFFYEVMNDPKTAVKIANEAFDVAIHQLEKIEDDQYKDSTTILQLLKENIDMWKTELQEQEDEGEGEKDE